MYLGKLGKLSRLYGLMVPDVSPCVRSLGTPGPGLGGRQALFTRSGWLSLHHHTAALLRLCDRRALE